MLDILALHEAIDIKSKLEAKKAKRIQKKEANMRELTKLNNGKNTIKTMFMSQDGKVNKITTLTHAISDVIFLFS